MLPWVLFKLSFVVTLNWVNPSTLRTLKLCSCCPWVGLFNTSVNAASVANQNLNATLTFIKEPSPKYVVGPMQSSSQQMGYWGATCIKHWPE